MSDATPYDTAFSAAGDQYGVDPVLLKEMARQESGFNPRATSPAGAEGIMQFMPGTAAGLGIDPLNPAQAITGAARLMANYLHDYNGDTAKALAAYNAGPAEVARYGGVPPFAETQEYVAHITARVAAAEKNGGSSSSGGGIHWRVPSLTDPLPVGGITDAVTGSITSGIRRIVLEGVLVIGAVGLIGAGAYRAMTGRSAAGDAAHVGTRAAELGAAA